MSWDSYRNDDRGEQEQLEIIRALIEDASNGDFFFWRVVLPLLFHVFAPLS